MTTAQQVVMLVGVATLFTLFVLVMGVIASAVAATLAGIMERSVSEGKAMFVHFITLGGK